MSALKGILKQLKRGKERTQNESLQENQYSSEEAVWPYSVVTAPALHKPAKSCPGAPYGDTSRSVFAGSATSTPRSSAQYPMHGGSVYELKTESSDTLQAYDARHEILKLRTRCRYHKEMASNYKEENDRLRNAIHQLTRRFEQLQEENAKMRETANASARLYHAVLAQAVAVVLLPSGRLDCLHSRLTTIPSPKI
ncbi:hypothetical protein AAVH_39961 [Aphelenchoides avenae]|nr:hypothetical protein AAVH_39961 [Aphelenchus avenae]